MEKVLSFYTKGIYFFSKRYILFRQKVYTFFGEGAIPFSKRGFGARIFGGRRRFLMYHSIEKDLWIDVVS